MVKQSVDLLELLRKRGMDGDAETLTRVCHEPPVKGGARTPVWCKYAVCSLRKG